jgi:hypothetical protein
VKQLLKSVVREIRTLRSVGAGARATAPGHPVETPVRHSTGSPLLGGILADDCYRLAGGNVVAGLQSSSPEALAKYSSTSCFLRESRKRPHMTRTF